jgi:hypothetical protein
MNEISLRDYLAIHAPAEPWPSFQPAIEYPPLDIPSINPVGNNGEYPTDDELKELTAWRMDGYDPEPEISARFSFWMAAWAAYHQKRIGQSKEYELERRAQWPWYYADQVIARRLKGST